MEEPPEVALESKMFSFIKKEMFVEFTKANREYRVTHEKEINLTPTEEDCIRGFFAWFMLKYTLKERFTPFEWSLLFWKEKFSEKEIQMIRNALNYIESFFKIEDISEDKRTYTLRDFEDNQAYTVQTIDLAPLFKEGDVLQATIVPRLDGDYFFKGNIITQTTKGMRIIQSMFTKLVKGKNKEQSPFIVQGKRSVKDKSRLLEAQHEMVETLRKYFGTTIVECKNSIDLKEKLDAFYDWRNKNWIVPGKGKTPEQLWKEGHPGQVSITSSPSLKPMEEQSDPLTLVADTRHGLAIIPYYSELKTFFRGKHTDIPDHFSFLYHIVVEKRAIPTFIIKQFVMENEKKSLKLLKRGYDNIDTIEEMIYLFASKRTDWSDSRFNPTITLLEDE